MWRFGWAFCRWLFSFVSSKDGCKFLMHIRVVVLLTTVAEDAAAVGVGVVMVLLVATDRVIMFATDYRHHCVDGDGGDGDGDDGWWWW